MAMNPVDLGPEAALFRSLADRTRLAIVRLKGAIPRIGVCRACCATVAAVYRPICAGLKERPASPGSTLQS
jgi:hypothetical protein